MADRPGPGARDLWSDGTIMWVALNRGDEISALEAYRLADGERVPVMDIPVGLDQVDFGHFIHGRPGYTAEVANSVNQATVSWEQAFTGGSVAVGVLADTAPAQAVLPITLVATSLDR